MDLSRTTLGSLILHKVGNKSAGEGISLSARLLQLAEPVKEMLVHYFCSPFKPGERFAFSHPSGLQYNEVYQFVSAIFDNPATLAEQSCHLARHLYEQSVHPRIRSGEFYVAYLRDITLDGEEVEAVGLFKSETREAYLKVWPVGDGFEVGHDDGININKLDKGCLIFNLKREEGFVTAIVDSTGKGSEARYWRDDFLQLTPCADEYHHTTALMQFTRKFVTEKLPAEFDITRADQVDLLNRSVKFLKQNESFELEDFGEQVLLTPDLRESFKNYRTELSGETDFDLPEEFIISGEAVKKQSRIMKSVIKLDKNFHIYVHGDRHLIEKGFDASRNLHYYQLYFHEEQ
jgi:hypothetical protein